MVRIRGAAADDITKFHTGVTPSLSVEERQHLKAAVEGSTDELLNLRSLLEAASKEELPPENMTL